MKIGRTEYKLARPRDLDEQLVELTGCSAAEIRGHLGAPSIASAVAAALLPFITGDKPERHELAQRIENAGTDKVRAEVLALYDKAPQAETLPAPAKGGVGDAKAEG